MANADTWESYPPSQRIEANWILARHKIAGGRPAPAMKARRRLRHTKDIRIFCVVDRPVPICAKNLCGSCWGDQHEAINSAKHPPFDWRERKRVSPSPMNGGMAR